MRITDLIRSRGAQGLAVVALGGVALVQGIERLGGAEAIDARLGMGAGFVTVPVQAVVAVSPVPGEIIAFLNVALYGFWSGAALCWMGWMMAAFIEYALVRRVARDLTHEAGPERMPVWLRKLPSHHPAFLILGRYLPFGSHVVNSTAGLHGVALSRFAWTAAVSLVPASLVFAAAAMGLVSLG